ncbi:hypothetical protein WAB17_06190 [Parerythrobacter aurantius]|uniref:hypothetical protein n=1 Tax=Parerythrobacter aurantius TaxID=3127706 RepID=UPI0032441ACC
MTNPVIGLVGRAVALAASAMLGLGSTAALARDAGPPTADPDAQIEFRVVQSGLDPEQSEEFDSSGFVLRGEAGIDFDLGKTRGARIEVDAARFEYEDDQRTDRTSYGTAIELRQAIGETVEIRLRARHVENTALLEASSADQTSIGVRLQWQEGNDRLRLSADYRWRQYDLAGNPEGEGLRLGGQYNRRFGSYHWLRFDAFHEDIESTAAPSRSYERYGAKVEYSQPLIERLRLKPALEYRRWQYDSRIALGDPSGARRADSFVGPALEFAYGRDDRGLFAEAGVQYRISTSNDSRYDDDAARFALIVGYRF